MSLFLILEEILGHTAQDGTTNLRRDLLAKFVWKSPTLDATYCAQEAVVGLLSEESTAQTSSNGTHQASVLIGHWGCIGIIVRGVGIR